jgi:hypothetical protein
MLRLEALWIGCGPEEGKIVFCGDAFSLIP